MSPSANRSKPTVINTILPLKRGEPFHTADARDTIQKLYATGRYEDIVIDANPHNGGVQVRITTRSSWFIGRVEIEGDVPDPPNAGQLVTASRLDLGQPFEKDMVKAAAENMRRLLVSNGFYNSTVDSTLEYDDLTQEVNITFTVSARRRARFGSAGSQERQPGPDRPADHPSQPLALDSDPPVAATHAAASSTPGSNESG